MNCPLCAASVPDGSGACPHCGASCETLRREGPSDDPLEECLPVGASLHGGHYQVGRVLGHGGFGVTYQGSDIPMRLPVAIKEFFPSGCLRRGLNLLPGRKLPTQEFSEQRARFLDEARLLARLNHTGIVRVYTAFEANNTAYMVMEYVRGKTLEALINERGRLGEKEVLGYVRKLAEALEVMHGQGEEGILHRDIKPANIMVTPEGRVVLIDFGTARQFAANVSRAMSQVLTPGYAPLEQYSARARFGPPVDIYALGATMYHAITGLAPTEAVERSQGMELVPPHIVCPSVSQRTSTGILAAMEMKATDRPQHISDMVQILPMEPLVPPPPLIPLRGRTAKNRRSTTPITTSPLSIPVASAPGPTIHAEPRLLVTNSRGFQEVTNEKDGTVLVLIPGGTFLMGSNQRDDEKPPHPVTLAPYLMAREPVTNAQFARFVSATACVVKANGLRCDWKKVAEQYGPQAPVLCVSWADACTYCRWAGLRLPTEAEWEYAARGPQNYVYPWGNEWDPSRCQNSTQKVRCGGASSTNSYPSGSSPFGCLDMVGNATEWTESWYDRYPGNTTTHCHFGRSRVRRGGSWGDAIPEAFRAARRDALPPCSRIVSGFRCARSVP